MSISSLLPATALAAGHFVGHAVGALGQLDRGFRAALAAGTDASGPAPNSEGPPSLEASGRQVEAGVRRQDLARETERLGRELRSMLAAGGIEVQPPIVLSLDDAGELHEVGGNPEWRAIEQLLSLDPAWSQQMNELERLMRAWTPGDALTRLHLTLGPDGAESWLA